ncbi:hypothetical protein NQ317_001584 [Molorchus minor]|uniref:Uncharacterized protein n=1 Tax=Molorchus minor TaxID=1323400 RepID=A0ABQ9J8H1_9CUCU|nr:hypothetical protein NQ317_001584 [Molorchus minor]
MRRSRMFLLIENYPESKTREIFYQQKTWIGIGTAIPKILQIDAFPLSFFLIISIYIGNVYKT